ncbi:DUF5133 domain-containing protein [Streptomyces sp. NBC_01334]|uniref:DUF5133 domain-containing protein n=1 Tax=Streptomyces sp. NBC_01334 TaxID=2903827 RepID=UPI003FA3677B
MLTPLPVTLRRLVKDYEDRAAHQSVAAAATSSARLRDLPYTLCVPTGTRSLRGIAGRPHLPRQRHCPARARRVLSRISRSADAPARLSGSEPQTPSRRRRSVVTSDAAAAHRSAAADLQYPRSEPWPATGEPRACHEPSAAWRRRLHTRTRGL